MELILKKEHLRFGPASPQVVVIKVVFRGTGKHYSVAYVRDPICSQRF